jgi:hypothetical protein
MSTLCTRSTDEFSDLKRAKMLKAVSEDAPSKAGLFRRAYSPKSNPRLAIKTKCLECCWLDEATIRECMATECPLWPFRPYQSKG